VFFFEVENLIIARLGLVESAVFCIPSPV